MNNRIKDKIEEIEEFLEQLKEIVPSTLEEYKSNIEKKAASERYIEKIVESVTDLAFLIIKLRKFEIPEDDIDAFNILSKNKFIDDNLSVNLKKAKGMRNIIAHKYGEIDDEIVFKAVTERLKSDVEEFIKKVKDFDIK